MEDVSLILLAITAWMLHSKRKKRGGVIKGCCQIHTHIVHSGFIYYTSANWSQSIFLSFSHYHSLSTRSFSFPHGFSPCFLFCSLIPHCSPPFFLFIQATGSLLIICDLLKLHSLLFPLILSLVFFIYCFLSSSWFLLSSQFPLLPTSITLFHFSLYHISCSLSLLFLLFLSHLSLIIYILSCKSIQASSIIWLCLFHLYPFVVKLFLFLRATSLEMFFCIDFVTKWNCTKQITTVVLQK